MTLKDSNISVIICAYTENRWQDTIAAVESVLHQTLPARDIILVIDYNPTLLELAKSYFPPEVMVIPNSQGRGVSGARNTGAIVAHGSILGFLDDDAIASPTWLERLLEGFNDKQVVGVGGRIDPNWESKSPAWFPQEFYWAIGATYKGMSEKPASVRNLWSGNLTVRREVFDLAGGFHKNFGKVGTNSAPEDTEFCIRALQNWPDCHWLFKPDARVRHKVPRNRATWKYFTWRCYNEGLGKAQLSTLVGIQHGLSSEATHTFRTLPCSVINNLWQGLWHRDISSLQKAGALVIGFTIVVSGYISGVTSSKFKQLFNKFSRLQSDVKV